MKIEEIRQLAEIMQAYGVESVELEEGDSRVRMRRPGAGAAEPAAPRTAPPAPSLPEVPAAAPEAGRVVTSPMVGIFYGAPAPGAEPYARVGRRVAPGEVLCIVEAMKMMNEIAAEFDGEVQTVHVRDGDVVEVGQPLLTLI